MKEQLDCRHGLTLDRAKGYKLRVVISRGEKVVGKRINIILHTHDEACAMMKRDVILHAYARLGITVVFNPYTRPDGQPEASPETPMDGEQEKSEP